MAGRLAAAGKWRPGDGDIIVALDAGYDVIRLAPRHDFGKRNPKGKKRTNDEPGPASGYRKLQWVGFW